MESFFYFFWISFTMSLALVLSVKRASQQGFPPNLNFQITGWLLVTIPTGARLFHILYEEPSYYWESPLRVLEVWKGGFVYYGGLIASVAFFVAFFKIRKRERSYWESADFFTPILCFGTGFGRFACFIQGCCYGREWDGLWSIGHRHPTQLYMFAWEMLLLVLMSSYEKRLRVFPGSLFLFWIGTSALGRFVIEYYRDDFRGHSILGLSVSQVVALFIMTTIVSLFILKSRKSYKVV